MAPGLRGSSRVMFEVRHSTRKALLPTLSEPGVLAARVPRSVDALADAMRSVIAANPNDLHAMGREGARRVRERHDAA